MNEITDYLKILKGRGLNVAVRELKSRLFRGNPINNLNNLLLLLKKYDIKATFFVVGYTAYYNQSIVSKMITEGHEIGVHGFFHKQINNMTQSELEYDLKLCKTFFKSYFDYDVVTYRAPYLSISTYLYRSLFNTGYHTSSSVFGIKNHISDNIMEYPVSYDDWNFLIKRGLSYRQMYEFVLKNIQGGECLLLHPFRIGQSKFIVHFENFLKKMHDRFDWSIISQLDKNHIALTGDIGELSNSEIISRIFIKN